MERNTWVQIHTNGGTTTFARWYAERATNNELMFVFEKMAVDTTTPSGSAEIFGREEFILPSGASARVAEAVALAR